jgi:hypothetical protein
MIVVGLAVHEQRAAEAVDAVEVSGEARGEALDERQPLVETHAEPLGAQVEQERQKEPPGDGLAHTPARRGVLWPSRRSSSCLRSTPEKGKARRSSSAGTPARLSTTSQSRSSLVDGFLRIPSSLRSA